MPYPLIFAFNGVHFARCNHDGEWSVKWDVAMNARYAPPTPRNKAMLAVTVVLLAAKDNFHLRAWDVSDAESGKWDRKDRSGGVAQMVIDVTDVDAPNDRPIINIAVGDEPFVSVMDDPSSNPPIKWSVKWDTVLELAQRDPMAENQKYVLLVALARLLRAARDNFPTTPWVDDDGFDDDDP